MVTKVWKVDPAKLDLSIISQAADLVKDGHLVAFPTETVYGVGALAFSALAVHKIFAAKNRSIYNPLLIHLSNITQVYKVVSQVPEEAVRLMKAFWPGPLSLVLAGGSHLPVAVQGEGGTVGLRMPSHPVALALIEQTGPLAATSANLSGRPSPITATDVMNDLQGRITAVIDGGEANSKLESTVVDLSVKPYRILRLGAVAGADLERVLPGRFLLDEPNEHLDRHYQIDAHVSLCPTPDQLLSITAERLGAGKKVAAIDNDVLTMDFPDGLKSHPRFQTYRLALQGKGMDIYTILRSAELAGMDEVLFAPLPEDEQGTYGAILARVYACVNSKPHSG